MVRTIYMLVTRDEYELPILVADSLDEVVRFTGKTKLCVKMNYYRKAKGYIRLRIDDEYIDGQEEWEDQEDEEAEE